VDQAAGGRELIRHKANALTAGLLLSPVFLAVAAGAGTGGVFLVKRHADSYLGTTAFIAAAFFLICAVAVPIAMFREGCIEEDADRTCETDCRMLEAALDEICNPTLSGLAKANFRQMRMFTVIALRQARMSYYACLAAASISLLVLAVGGAMTIGLVGATPKVAAGSVTAVGVALSGFLSAIFLKTYWMSARQMSYYYGQPLVHCYLLHAEWLTLTLAEHPEWKADGDLWRQVIAASLQAGEKAQSHLLSMQEHASSARGNLLYRVNDHNASAAAGAPTASEGE
jgi:hypothetical protein